MQGSRHFRARRRLILKRLQIVCRGCRQKIPFDCHAVGRSPEFLVKRSFQAGDLLSDEVLVGFLADQLNRLKPEVVDHRDRHLLALRIDAELFGRLLKTGDPLVEEVVGLRIVEGIGPDSGRGRAVGRIFPVLTCRPHWPR